MTTSGGVGVSETAICGVTMFTDPVLLFDLGVISSSVIFLGWTWSPSQRSRRRHEAARDRIEVRRKLNATTVSEQAEFVPEVDREGPQ